MMVATQPSGEMLGVKIVSMSETPGLGSRVGADEHLSQYQGDFWYGHDKDLTLGEDIDAISGATISSRAVNEGVNRALEALLSYRWGEEGAQ
jgi:electron transport complex protein RnfG